MPVIKAFLATLQSLFLRGLFTILPLALTVGIFSYSFHLLKRWLAPISRIEPAFLKAVPHSELLVTILTLLAIGAFMKFFMARHITRFIESLIRKLPVVRHIYFGTQKLVHALSPQDTNSFQKAVLVEFPRSNMWSIGFMTGTAAIQPPGALQATPLVTLFIPTTPNPTSGFYVMVREDQYIPTTLTRQEAMTIIISGGVIKPEHVGTLKTL
jgi:uncharacterized membrane protein